MAYSAEVLADAPQQYLRLNDASGTVASDSSGNGNNGTYVGNPTLGATSLLATDPDPAVQTTGNQQVTAPFTPTSTTFSIELWWKWTADGTSGSVWRDNTSAGSAGYFLGVHSTGVTVRIAGSTRTCSLTDYRDNIRHHFVFTYDGTTATLYIDGTQIDQWTRTTSTLPATPIHIGYNGTNAGQYQPGVYDEFAVYGSVLSSARVATHYTEAGQNPSSVQTEAVFLETLTTGSPMAQVEASFLETLTTGSKNAMIGASFLEAMTLVQPAQVSSVYAETLLSTAPPVQVETLYAETLLTTTPTIQIPSLYVEALLLPVANTSFKGWGVPI